MSSVSGLTIMEVLIAAVIFMIGFTLLTFLLSGLGTRYSPVDKIAALNLARRYMEETLALDDCNESDQIVRLSGVRSTVKR